MDGANGTMDPAFNAHLLPLKYWATAWWEGWATPSSMDESFQMAAFKLGRRDRISWNAVTGPATAIVASLERIGWRMPNAREVVDEMGNTW
eukprot:7901829-Karenia_brevis.AAC.1